ncbi:hypothetical protein GGS21DRAFT_324051 [Xylaria nigripes]|nr:hypothetical protein GGS21DRAFT_324051 [Xylaria nigripes]
MSSASTQDASSTWLRIILVNAALNGLTVFVVGLRWWSRRLTRAGLGWDDGCALAAVVFLNAMLLVLGLLIGRGFGIPTGQIDRGNARTITVLGHLFRFLFLCCLCFVKLSALFFYLRVFGTRVLSSNLHSNSSANLNDTNNSRPASSYIRPSLRSLGDMIRKKPSRRQIYIFLIILVILWTIANLIQEVAVCDVTRPMCKKQRPTDLGICIFNAAGDLVILLLPLWPIWRLQMKKTTKIGLSIVFLLGIVTIFVAFLRFESILRTEYGGDFNRTALRSANYAILEPNLAILCISLPMLQPLLRHATLYLSGCFSALRKISTTLTHTLSTSRFTDPSPASGNNSNGRNSNISQSKDAPVSYQGAPDEGEPLDGPYSRGMVSRVRSLWIAGTCGESRNNVRLTTLPAPTRSAPLRGEDPHTNH